MQPFLLYRERESHAGTGVLVHQSMLSEWDRCAARVGYRRAGEHEDSNSAMAFGSVIHFALLALETLRAEGRPFEECVERAVQTFQHYWHPSNIEAICEPVPADGWIAGQSYGILLQRGAESIRQYADLIRYDDHELLGLEYGFVVPVLGTWDEELGQPHMLGGTIDRLAVRHYSRKLAVAVDDLKSGRDYKGLRYNLQFTAYCYATEQKVFWTGTPGGEDGFGEERGTQLYERFLGAGRRGTWINLRKFKFQDAGWRGPVDYERFRLAVEQITKSIQAEIFPLSLSGTNCQYCPHRNICGEVGIPDDVHGDPRVGVA